jgi:hypothetical protein
MAQDRMTVQLINGNAVTVRSGWAKFLGLMYGLEKSAKLSSDTNRLRGACPFRSNICR